MHNGFFSVSVFDFVTHGKKTSFWSLKKMTSYRAFRRFGLAKFAGCGSISGSSQFTLLSRVLMKTIFDLKKNTSKST